MGAEKCLTSCDAALLKGLETSNPGLTAEVNREPACPR